LGVGRPKSGCLAPQRGGKKSFPLRDATAKRKTQAGGTKRKVRDTVKDCPQRLGGNVITRVNKGTCNWKRHWSRKENFTNKKKKDPTLEIRPR